MSETGHSYGNATGNSCVGLKAEWEGTSGDHQGGANSMSQVNGNTDMAWNPLASSVLGGVGSSKEQCLLPSLPLGESCSAPPALTLMLDN